MEERRRQDERIDKIMGLLQETRDAAIANKTLLREHVVPTMDFHLKEDNDRFQAQSKRIAWLERGAWTLTGALVLVSSIGAWLLKKGGFDV